MKVYSILLSFTLCFILSSQNTFSSESRSPLTKEHKSNESSLLRTMAEGAVVPVVLGAGVGGVASGIIGGHVATAALMSVTGGAYANIGFAMIAPYIISGVSGAFVGAGAGALSLPFTALPSSILYTLAMRNKDLLSNYIPDSNFMSYKIELEMKKMNKNSELVEES